MTAHPLYRTPAFAPPAAYAGFVHSIYRHTANLMLETPAGLRMLTLCPAGAPRVPDSVVLPPSSFGGIVPGDHACLEGALLVVGNLQFILDTEQSWTGHIPPQSGAPQAAAFFARTSHLRQGFLRMPPAMRQRVDRALVSADAPGLLGLGGGLTPSFDDACVGVLAVCRALNIAAPFSLTDISRTTDVSGRYLRLAWEGYFGEAVGHVITALFCKGDLPRAVWRLCQIGATSGCDMLYGMSRILRELPQASVSSFA